MKKLKVLDLFSGIGAFSLGLERAGMETVAFCETDQNCRKVLMKHWPHIHIWGDVKTITKTSLDRYVPHKIDLICGGFPCQDISVAGKKKGLKGERSGLWYQFKRLIKEIRPRYALIENVANLRRNGLAQIIQDLWAIGYVGEWHILSARSVGAPHLRERVWIIAYTGSAGTRLEKHRGSGQIRGIANQIESKMVLQENGPASAEGTPTAFGQGDASHTDGHGSSEKIPLPTRDKEKDLQLGGTGFTPNTQSEGHQGRHDQREGLAPSGEKELTESGIPSISGSASELPNANHFRL